MSASDDSEWANSETAPPSSSPDEPIGESKAGLFVLPDWNDSVLDAVVHASSRLEPRVAAPRPPARDDDFARALRGERPDVSSESARDEIRALLGNGDPGRAVTSDSEAEAFFAAARQASMAADRKKATGSQPSIDLDSGLLNLESGNFDLSSSGYDSMWGNGGSGFDLAAGMEGKGDKTSGLLSVAELREVPNQLTDILQAIEEEGGLGRGKPPAVPPAARPAARAVSSSNLDAKKIGPSPLPPNPRAGDRRPRRANFDLDVAGPGAAAVDEPPELDVSQVEVSGGRYAASVKKSREAAPAVRVRRPGES